MLHAFFEIVFLEALKGGEAVYFCLEIEGRPIEDTQNQMLASTME